MTSSFNKPSRANFEYVSTLQHFSSWQDNSTTSL